MYIYIYLCTVYVYIYRYRYKYIDIYILCSICICSCKRMLAFLPREISSVHLSVLATRCCVPAPPPDQSSTGCSRCCLYPICPQSSGLSASAVHLRASPTAVASVRLGAARGRGGTKSLCNQHVRLGGDGGSAGMQTFTVGPSRPCKQQRRYKRGRLNNR